MLNTRTTLLAFAFACAVCAFAFGANIPVGTGDSVQGKINAANAGDVLVFAPGTYQLGETTGKDGVSMKGGNAATLNFQTGNDKFGYRLASNQTINGFFIRANCGAFFGQGLSNVRITNNDFVWGGNGVYYQRHAFRIQGGSKIIVEHNYFHDSTASDRACDVWDLSDSSISYNVYDNINDGGHMDGLSVRNKLSYNLFTRIRRMGFEWQDHNHWEPGQTKGSDNQCVGNAFHTPSRAFADTFAYSIMMQGATGTVIKDNYLEANATSFDTPSGWPTRLGIGIEAGGSGGIVVENNVIVNPGAMVGGGKQAWVQGITYSMQGTVMRNNKFYGVPGEWGWHGAEGGSEGNGGLNAGASTGNVFPPASGNAPVRPTAASLGAGIGGVIQPIPDPTPVAMKAPLSVFGTTQDGSNVSNGYGPPEVNTSNGESAQGDGKPMSIAGVKFNAGLGTHAPFAAKYLLAAGHPAGTFFCNFGIDDEVGARGSVALEVLLDGVNVYTSGVARGGQPAIPVSVPVPAGKTTLELRVNVGGDDFGYDHADIADAKVVAGVTPPPGVLPSYDAIVAGYTIQFKVPVVVGGQSVEVTIPVPVPAKTVRVRNGYPLPEDATTRPAQ